jgi:predicted nucleic acid-binding protein
MLVLDSTVLIDGLRGRPAAGRISGLLRGREVMATTAINVEEVVRGLRAAEFDRARALFAGLTVLAIGAGEGWLAGEWRRDSAARGLTLSQPDGLIAATVHTAGARLATGNPADFAATPVPVEHWPVGL